MIIKGICSICGAVEVLHTCHLCGKNICSTCYDSPHGVCVNCARGRI